MAKPKVTERERAYYGEQIVTIIKGKIGRRGKVTIRNGFGFTEEVEAKELVRIEENDPMATLRIREDG